MKKQTKKRIFNTLEFLFPKEVVKNLMLFLILVISMAFLTTFIFAVNKKLFVSGFEDMVVLFMGFISFLIVMFCYWEADLFPSFLMLIYLIFAVLGIFNPIYLVFLDGIWQIVLVMTLFGFIYRCFGLRKIIIKKLKLSKKEIEE